MEEETTVSSDDLQSEEENDTPENEPAEDDEQVDVDKLKELAKNQKIRAEKAERELKKLKSQSAEETPKKEDKPVKVETSNYSLVDIRALNKVHDDDVERVEKFAKSEGVSIADALKNDDLQAILRDREEKRKTAAATNTSGSRRGTSKTSPERLLEEANRGNLPTDDEGIKRLVEAEFDQRRASVKRRT